jgi:hypothetical protein
MVGWSRRRGKGALLRDNPRRGRLLAIASVQSLRQLLKRRAPAQQPMPFSDEHPINTAPTDRSRRNSRQNPAETACQS